MEYIKLVLWTCDPPSSARWLVYLKESPNLTQDNTIFHIRDHRYIATLEIRQQQIDPDTVTANPTLFTKIPHGQCNQHPSLGFYSVYGVV